ncbi:MAG: sarcosine oxidase subunit gamma family protein [Alphaproteobacteria bacterium]|nr:sarcosine oxidase subunit gamma family protein [Alphaproteobacteria bacterium]
MADGVMLKSSPLGDRPSFQGVQTRIEELPFLGKLTLRGEPSSEAFMAAAESILGVAPPTAPNTSVFADGRTICWIGPNEWLIHTEENAQTDLKDALQTALDGIHAAVVDVSDTYTVIQVGGPRARDVLAKGCPLDLHPRTFGPGRCAGSVYIKAVIHLYQTDGAPTYRLQVRWSFADYLWRNLVRAAEEWG